MNRKEEEKFREVMVTFKSEVLKLFNLITPNVSPNRSSTQNPGEVLSKVVCAMKC